MAEWASTTEATTYLATRLGAGAWAGLSNAVKQAAMTTAYNRIVNDPDMSTPTSPTAAQLAKLKPAQILLAWYLYLHISDEDRRKGIQAQGVTDAGIVKESYDRGMMGQIPYPPEVVGLLKEFKESKHFFVVEIDRDDTQAVGANVVED